MSGIRPFRGMVVRPEVAHDVVSPAYDALTVSQRRQFRLDHPDSYLHVTRSAADEPDADTVDNITLVNRGRAALEQILSKNLFTTHGEPAFYVYRLTEAGHSQYGVVCEVGAEYFAAVAQPHEQTEQLRAALLAEHFLTVRAASSPIACAVRDTGDLEDVLRSAAVGDSVLDMTGADGLRQTIWRVSDPDVAEALSAAVDHASLFIIDGHHRAAANQHILDTGTSLPVLAVVFPEQSLHLVGFHRLVRLPDALDETTLLHGLRRRFSVEATSDVASVAAGSIATFLLGEWQIVRFDERPVSGDSGIRLGSLDPVVFEREVLQSIVGAAGDVDVSYMPDVEPFATMVAIADSERRVPFFVPPVSMDDLMAVATGGRVMPPKSTYFTPKVRSGLFLRLLDELI